jgi:hypothetical protein
MQPFQPPLLMQLHEEWQVITCIAISVESDAAKASPHPTEPPEPAAPAQQQGIEKPASSREPKLKASRLSYETVFCTSVIQSMRDNRNPRCSNSRNHRKDLKSQQSISALYYGTTPPTSAHVRGALATSVDRRVTPILELSTQAALHPASAVSARGPPSSVSSSTQDVPAASADRILVATSIIRPLRNPDENHTGTHASKKLPASAGSASLLSTLSSDSRNDTSHNGQSTPRLIYPAAPATPVQESDTTTPPNAQDSMVYSLPSLVPSGAREALVTSEDQNMMSAKVRCDAPLALASDKDAR